MDTPSNALNDNRIGATKRIDGPIGLVIVTYNSADVLPGLLDSLHGGLEGVVDFKVVVVDNSSKDSSIAIATEHSIGATVINSGRNAGYSAAINIAAAHLGEDYHILILNPDIRLNRGSVAQMCRALEDPLVGIVVPQILDEDGTVSKSIRREPSLVTVWSEALIGGRLAARLGLGEMVDRPQLYCSGGPVEWATGAILLVSARARRAVGDWDESFFLYSEEVDYFQRLRRADFIAKYVPESQATHIGGDYERSNFLSALMAVNRIKYYSRDRSEMMSLLFRLGVVVGEFVRWPKSSAHRAAFNAALAARLNH
jgi:N-acetylglucosaminyl-diphospho-decaprenol L-rhamnosyltransferase